MKTIPFSIVTCVPGVEHIAIQGVLDEASTYILRLELSNVLRRRPTVVQLSVARTGLFDQAGQGLLMSFCELLRAQGGRLELSETAEDGGSVIDPKDLERFLAAKVAPARSRAVMRVRRM